LVWISLHPEEEKNGKPNLFSIVAGETRLGCELVKCEGILFAIG